MKIKLFKDNQNYQSDVFVGVNGKTYKIKRGVEVSVPDCVWEVIENSLNQNDIAASYMAAAAENQVKREREIKK